MNFTEKVGKLVHNVEQTMSRRAPELLAGAGIACFIASTIAAIKIAPKAAKKLEDRKKDLKVEKLPVKEVVTTVGLDYLPVGIGIVSGTGFTVASVVDSNNKYMALSTSYGLLKDFAYTYKDKVVETIGEKKEEKIRNEIAQEKLDKDQITENKIIITKEGNTLFKDSLTGQYFRSDINKFKSKAIELANTEISEDYAGVPEWLLDLGLNVPDTMLGIGWSAPDQGKIVTVSFSACVAHSYNDEPCLVVEYDPMPISDYYIYYK